MNKFSTIALYTVTHDNPISITLENEIAIQVGAAQSSHKICQVTDDTGENISAKNARYCELTALYWIWKNDTHTIVGLNHYRRKFRITSDSIIQKLNSFDVIVPKPYYFRESLDKEYSKAHIRGDWNRLMEILINNNPDSKDIINATFSSNKLYPYNMFIASKGFLNEYCQWLFPILFSLEDQIDFFDKDAYQTRIMGFVSERLFTLYLALKKISYYECPVMIPEKSDFFRYVKYVIGTQFNKNYFLLRN